MYPYVVKVILVEIHILEFVSHIQGRLNAPYVVKIMLVEIHFWNLCFTSRADRMQQQSEGQGGPQSLHQGAPVYQGIRVWC